MRTLIELSSAELRELADLKEKMDMLVYAHPVVGERGNIRANDMWVTACASEMVKPYGKTSKPKRRRHLTRSAAQKLRWKKFHATHNNNKKG